MALLPAVVAACTSAPVEIAGEEEAFPTRIETRWTDRFEWFVEHPLLVAGMEASFAVHLTRLDGFRPIEEGRMTVELLAPDGSLRQRVEAESPARSGIFVPTLVPEAAGGGSLRLTYRGPSGETDEVDWTVRVAANVEDLDAAPAGPEGIAFLKEQQWRIPFATIPVGVRAMRETIVVPAVIEAHPRHVAEVAAPAEGILMAPEGGLPLPGARVRRGEVLALVSPPLGTSAGWHTLEAELAEATNRLAHAEQEHARASRLVEAGAVPARRLQEAALERDNAAARLAAARNQAGTFERLIAGESFATPGLPLRAPIEGIVAAVNVTAGEPVDHDRALFRIVDLDHLVVRAELPETELARLLEHAARGEALAAAVTVPDGARGDGARVWVPAQELLELGTEIDTESRTAPVRFTIGNDSGALRPGMSVEMSVRIGLDHEVLAVPEAAVADVAGVTTAYVQLSGETFIERVVETGMRNSGWIEIRSGLAAGERVATLGAYQVRLAGLSPEAAPAAHSH
jgi:RND family efflux transporter MFP subunit